MERTFFHRPFSHGFSCDYGTDFPRDEPSRMKILLCSQMFTPGWLLSWGNGSIPHSCPSIELNREKRVYLDALLVGIPDASVFQQNPEANRPSIVTTGVLNKPIRVTLPLTEEITEPYLEIRQVKTGRVVIVVEVLSLKNKLLVWRSR